MDPTLTASVRDLLAREGWQRRTVDLYSAEGARFYDALVGADRSEVREFLAIARPVRGRILDLAAGSGRMTRPFLSLGLSVTALDLSADMLYRLRAEVPESRDLEIIQADMRRFTTERRFELVVLAATSITLLDAQGRRDLFDRVRHHLTPGGRFAFSIARGGAHSDLARTIDRRLAVETESGTRDYLSSQEVIAAGAQRIVNFAPLDGEGPVFTTRLHIVDDVDVADELVASGFRAPTVRDVRSSAGTADDLVILETTCLP